MGFGWKGTTVPIALVALCSLTGCDGSTDSVDPSGPSSSATGSTLHASYQQEKHAGYVYYRASGDYGVLDIDLGEGRLIRNKEAGCIQLKAQRTGAVFTVVVAPKVTVDAAGIRTTSGQVLRWDAQSPAVILRLLEPGVAGSPCGRQSVVIE